MGGPSRRVTPARFAASELKKGGYPRKAPGWQGLRTMRREVDMKDEMDPAVPEAAEELSQERSEFSHRLASFGLGERPARLLEDAPRRTRPETRPRPE